MIRQELYFQRMAYTSNELVGLQKNIPISQHADNQSESVCSQWKLTARQANKENGYTSRTVRAMDFRLGPL